MISDVMAAFLFYSRKDQSMTWTTILWWGSPFHSLYMCTLNTDQIGSVTRVSLGWWRKYVAVRSKGPVQIVWHAFQNSMWRRLSGSHYSLLYGDLLHSFLSNIAHPLVHQQLSPLSIAFHRSSKKPHLEELTTYRNNFKDILMWII